MANLASFWFGGDLGPIELASISSFHRHGDQITVYSPHAITNLPKNAIWRDANEILPSQTILRHRKTNSPALHSDLFRYALLAKTDQIWVDLDIISLRSFETQDPWVLGFENDTEVNGAVLHMPRNSQTLAALMEVTPATNGVPPFLQGRRRARYALYHQFHSLFGDGLTIDRWPWGGVGPRLLTHLLNETGEIEHVKPVERFYAIPFAEAGRFLEPNGLSRADLPSDAWAVHLWNNRLKRILAKDHGGQVPEGSFLKAALEGDL